MTIYGNWALTWADSDHVGVSRSHLLQMPLQRIRPGVKVNKHTATSLDYSTQNTKVFGSAYEVTASIKADKNPGSLADLLEAGIKGVALTLQDLAQPDRSVSVYLVDPDDLWLAAYDSQGTPWEFETQLKLRKTDGTAFPDWLLYQAYGAEGLLFKYTAGMDLSAATFTRAASANYINVSGVTTAAATNVARDSHFQTLSSTWTRTLRLELSTSESLVLPFNHVTQDLTVYTKFVERGSISTAAARYWGVGGWTGTDGSAWMMFQVNSTTIGLAHNDTTETWETGASVATSHSAGDVIEACAQFDVSNSEQSLYATVNGGAILSTTGAVISNVDAAWDANVIALNGWGTEGSNDRGTLDFIEFKVAAGVQSMARMRAL